jgi:hypothetical protein
MSVCLVLHVFKKEKTRQSTLISQMPVAIRPGSTNLSVLTLLLQAPSAEQMMQFSVSRCRCPILEKTQPRSELSIAASTPLHA